MGHGGKDGGRSRRLSTELRSRPTIISNYPVPARPYRRDCGAWSPLWMLGDSDAQKETKLTKQRVKFTAPTRRRVRAALARQSQGERRGRRRVWTRETPGPLGRAWPLRHNRRGAAHVRLIPGPSSDSHQDSQRHWSRERDRHGPKRLACGDSGGTGASLGRSENKYYSPRWTAEVAQETKKATLGK
ncbi:hypothetical protein NDU88_006920 [Pleurodeles waltl]|uniref:Uncharacterized protein n=1 Tax=Pleurodeles waltl TaxID=8319 RepID=A0AAV7LTY4_PLEWA|nr:hypothetical protein NDU88_006920 [Pleurodeles waltl]